MAGEVACSGHAWVPDELVEEIFCRLPVKSLMRFICINKFWCDVIKDPIFISKHLGIFNETNNTYLFLKNPNPTGELFSLFSFEPATNTTSLNLLDLNKPKGFLQLKGPCNGVYCLVPYNNRRVLFINPAMREYMVLPDNYDNAPLGTCRMLSAGFGFDAKTNDYKVVKIIEQWEPLKSWHWHVEMYTLSSNSWRKVTKPWHPLKRIYSFSGPTVFLHGASHWLVRGEFDNDDVGGTNILVFDMVDDMFRIINVRIEFPEFSESQGILKFKDTLAMIYLNILGRSFEFWVMEEYGNEGSWTKNFIINEANRELKRPLLFCKDNRWLLFLDKNGRLVFYDLGSKEVINLGYQVNYRPSTIMATLYEESLISLSSLSEQTKARVSIFSMLPQAPFGHRITR